MEPHPIPQNVTSFQFRLIGDMTLKQFLYLASGVGFAYLIFVVLGSSYPILAWPIIIISSCLGLAFAFLPIGARPLDHWLSAFLKAIYSPTKRAWKKNSKPYSEDPLFKSRYIMYAASIQPLPKEVVPVQKIPQPPQNNKPPQAPIFATQPLPPPAPELPTGEELKKTVDLAKEAQQLQMKIVQTERTLSHIRTESSKPATVPVDYSHQINKILADLQSLINQASEVKEQIATVTKPAQQPGTLAPSTPVEKVRVVIAPKPKTAQLALTTFPNVINGIIKDAQGNYLERVVVVIYDKEGLPVRALKTNKLGQFSGSTPLPNGTYRIELEKDNFSFDVLEVELEGGVLPPLMISAKQ